MSDKPFMDAAGKSDRPVVPAKAPNKEDRHLAEGLEGSGLIEENVDESHTGRTQRRKAVSPEARRRAAGAAIIRDRSRVRESRTHGSVRGVPGNGYPYRDPRTDSSVLRSAINPAAWLPTVLSFSESSRGKPGGLTPRCFPTPSSLS